MFREDLRAPIQLLQDRREDLACRDAPEHDVQVRQAGQLVVGVIARAELVEVLEQAALALREAGATRTSTLRCTPVLESSPDPDP
jgi:hypothetical protein